jgi:hypothetical protein
VEIDRRRVDRARQVNLLARERADVGGRDPGGIRVVVAAARIPAEACPVVARRRDRLARAVDAARRAAAASAGGEPEPRYEDQS